MSPKRTWAALMAALALSGCGNDPNAGGGMNMALELARSTLKQKPASPARPLTVTPEMLQRIGRLVILARIHPRKAEGLLVKQAQNGSITTYRGGDGAAVMLDHGILAATRGLGSDIMAAETEPVIAALKRGEGHYQRRVEYLDGENHLSPLTLDCRLSRAGPVTITLADRAYHLRRFTERCTSPSGLLVNHFDLDARGRIRHSRQWIDGEQTLEISQLRDE